MSLRVAISLALGAGAALLGGTASADVPPPVLYVRRAEVRFPTRDGIGGRLFLEAALKAGIGDAAIDPRVDALRLALGPVVLLEGPPWPGRVKFRESKAGWVLTLRDGFGEGTLAKAKYTAGGRTLRVWARGFDPKALLAAGPEGVPATVIAAGETFPDAFDFQVRSARRWTYRRPLQIKDAPDGGDGDGGDGGGSGGGSGGPTVVTLAQGVYQTGIRSFRWEVVRDPVAWAQLWQEHGGTGSPPAVDFSTRMVLGIWLGTKMSGGYWVSIQGMAPPGGSVPIVEFQDAAICPATGGLTYPYHIVSAPRLEGPVPYQLTVQIRYCP